LVLFFSNLANQAMVNKIFIKLIYIMSSLCQKWVKSESEFWWNATHWL